jgi:MoxR-like ATPase
VLEELLTCILARGNGLMEGVPGLAKTLMISTLSDLFSLSFNRIQFTPDLMPSDITGTDVLEEDRTTGRREIRFIKGPIFAHVILADEINRTPPKTQAALLEAMQERQITAGGQRFSLPKPFFVLATQNPIEQEGTYPLPEAQLDRFMFKIKVDYPTEDEEYQIVEATTGADMPELEAMLNEKEILELQEIVRRVPAAPHVIRYAMALSRATRVSTGEVPEFVREWVSWGAGPRASQYLILGSKARAVLKGRYHVSSEDVQSVAYPVLRHRILTNFNAEAEGISSDDIIKRLIESIPTTSSDSLEDPRMPKVMEA